MMNSTSGQILAPFYLNVKTLTIKSDGSAQ